MPTSENQRQLFLESLADYLLQHGLRDASLRPMAAAAGTSDRMLLYYFGDKRALVDAALQRVAERLLAMLDAVRPGRLPFAALLELLWALLEDEKVQPYLCLWLDLAAHAAREPLRYGQVAARIADGFMRWITQTLDVDNEEERHPMAAQLFATMEGMVLLNAVGSRETALAALQRMRRQ